MIKHYQITEDELNNKTFEAGSLYYCIDTKRIYLDSVDNNGRVLVGGDPIILSKESDRTNLLSPIPGKIYIVLESTSMYVYDGQWYSIINTHNHDSVYSKLGHKHTKSEITDFPSSMPASDVYSWAKASSKPSYAWSEITNKPTTFTPSSHGNHVPTIETANNARFLRNDNTWQTITPANIGAAPSSLISGDYVVYSDADINTVITSEYNKISTYSKKNIILNDLSGNTIFKGGAIFVELNYINGNYGTITAIKYNIYGIEKWYNCIYNGSFTGWQHYNPRMIIDTEYRTSEYFLDMPVYTKLIDCGSTPNYGTQKQISIPTNYVIDVHMVYDAYYNGTYFTGDIDTFWGVSVTCNGSTITLKTTAEGFNVEHCYAIIKYVY